MLSTLVSAIKTQSDTQSFDGHLVLFKTQPSHLIHLTPFYSTWSCQAHKRRPKSPGHNRALWRLHKRKILTEELMQTHTPEFTLFQIIHRKSEHPELASSQLFLGVVGWWVWHNENVKSYLENDIFNTINKMLTMHWILAGQPSP